MSASSVARVSVRVLAVIVSLPLVWLGTMSTIGTIQNPGTNSGRGIIAAAVSLAGALAILTFSFWATRKK